MSFKKIDLVKYIPPPCNFKEHNPPKYIVLEPGLWEWTCSHCGKTQLVTIPKIKLSA